MDKLEAMHRFVTVARIGSFTKAAEVLNLPKSTVSTAVQNLEKTLGIRLLHRSTRSVKLSQDGHVYFTQCCEILAKVDAVESEFQRSPEVLRGVLRVDMPSRFASTVLIPHLSEFLTLHPSIQLKVSTADYRVDLIKEGIDCVIRAGHLSDSALIARPLTHYRMYNCVSPRYLQQHGIPDSLASLSEHYLIDYDSSLGNGDALFEYEQEGKKCSLAMRSNIVVNGTDAYISACLNGLGIAQIPAIGAREYIQLGSLVRVLPEYEEAPMPITLLYPSRQHIPRRLQVFMDWLFEVVQQLDSKLLDDEPVSR